MLKNIISKFILIIFTSLVISLILLLNGIKIDSLSFDTVEIDGLYLEYDKKLILSVDKLKINSSKDETQTKIDTSALSVAVHSLQYFKSITLKDIEYDKYNVSLEFRDDIFSLFLNKNTQINLEASLENNILEYNIYSNNIKDLNFINNFVDLTPQIKDIIKNKLSFESIKLQELNGKINLENIDDFDIKSLNATLLAKKLKFKESKIPTVYFEQILITLKNGNINTSIKKTINQEFITFDGNIKTTTQLKDVSLGGVLLYNDIEIHTSVDIENNIAIYMLSTNKIKNLDTIQELLLISNAVQLTSEIKELIQKQLTFDNIKLTELKGKIDLDKIDSFDIKSITAIFMIDKLKLTYPEVPVVLLDEILITLQNGNINTSIKQTNNQNYITFNGNIGTTIEIDNINLLGSLSYDDIKIETDIEKRKNILEYDISTNNIKDLKTIQKLIANTSLIKLEQNIEELIQNQLFFENIKLTELKGKIDLNKIDNFDIKSVTTTLTAKKLKLKYSDVPILFLDEAYISLKNGQLNLDTKKVDDTQFITYNGNIKVLIDQKIIDINGQMLYDTFHIDTNSKIKLDDLYTIDIKYFNMLNQELYLKGIVNVDPKDMTSDTKKLDVDNLELIFDPMLLPFSAKKLYVKFYNDDILLSGNKLFYGTSAAEGSTAVLQDILSDKTTILKLDIQTKVLLAGELLNIIEYYIDTKLPIYQSSGVNEIQSNIDIPFSDAKVDVSAIFKSTNTKFYMEDNAIPIKKLYFTLDTDNIINTTINIDDNNQSLEILSNIDLNTDKIKGKVKVNNITYEDILEIQNEEFNYNVNLDNNMTIVKIPEFDLSYKNIGNKHDIKIDSFNKVLKFIKPIKEEPKDNIALSLINNDNFKTINLDINNMHIKLNPAYFDKEDTVDIEDKNETKTILPTIKLNLQNGSIGYDDYDIVYDAININTKESEVYVKYKQQDNSIFTKIDINDKNITIHGSKITGTFINKLAKKEIVKDGFLTLWANGKFDHIKGKIEFHKTTIQNVTMLTSLISFINTTPALINPILVLPTVFRLGETGFDMQGYHINNGWIEFDYDSKKELLKIPSIYTNNTMMDFKVKGNINLKTKQIKTTIDVIFMKDYAKFLNYIPLVGYIITGDDGNFVTQIDVYGSLDEPEFETHTVKNISRGIGNMLIRTITLPFKGLNALFDSNTTKEDEELHNKRIKELFNY